MNSFPNNLKRLRKNRNLKQEELAEILNVTRQTVSGWETGRRQPDLNTLKELAEALNADIHELIYGVKPGEYPCYQRKFVVRCWIFAVLMAAVGIFWMFGMPVLKQYFSTTFDPIYINLQFILPQLGWFAAGALLPNGLALVHPIRMPDRKAKILLIGGILLGLPAFLIGMETFLKIWLSEIPMISVRLFGLFEHPKPTIILAVLPLLSGLLIFLGLNRE